MDFQLVWWALVLIVLGICLAAAAVGYLAAYLILKIQKRPWPYTRLFFGRRDDLPLGGSAGPAAPKAGPQPTAEQKARKAAEETALRLTQKWQEDRETSRGSGQAESPHLVGELETNAKIAASASDKALQSFNTSFYDSSQKAMADLADDVQERVTAAYTDMHLANTLVSLSKKSSGNDNEIAKGYLKLCSKISSQLDVLIPALKNSRTD
jgi:hypothetical protein